MRIINVDVYYVKDGFHLLFKKVPLELPDNVQVVPKPPDKECTKAFYEQHPVLADSVPIHSVNGAYVYRCCIIFEASE